MDNKEELYDHLIEELRNLVKNHCELSIDDIPKMKLPELYQDLRSKLSELVGVFTDRKTSEVIKNDKKKQFILRFSLYYLLSFSLGILICIFAFYPILFPSYPVVYNIPPDQEEWVKNSLDTFYKQQIEDAKNLFQQILLINHVVCCFASFWYAYHHSKETNNKDQDNFLKKPEEPLDTTSVMDKAIKLRYEREGLSNNVLKLLATSDKLTKYKMKEE